MRAMFLRAAALCALAAGVPAANAQTGWPNGAKAAVVLTYDDALTSQLDHVVPELDAAGFKGTFFLANVAEGQVERWRKEGEAAENGDGQPRDAVLAAQLYCRACARPVTRDSPDSIAAA